jgi:hypothetical protein
MWEQHLAIAERHLAEARQHVVRQRQVIFEFRRDAHNTTRAQALLATFDRLKAELSR